ncbi:PQQ-dependent sugar dehydrogenase [Azospirillum halopraeferens]|uniref:PQQ-dependent sugar dehydrogenase n=1 Tax=Azospirillum halopraeferens TaxID=34010 RepID=UPI000407E580|nr:PQQ-dependent sugar dehydrogenase [Azospirillum halopraeferens]
MRCKRTASVAAVLAAFALAAPAGAQDTSGLPDGADSIETMAGPIQVEVFADGLEHPWAIAFLPDGRALVTERPGRLRILDGDGGLSDPLEGTPEVFAQDQGGLLDVAIAPDFDENRYVYLSYAEQGEGGTAGTTLGRGTLADDRIENFEVIFRQEKVEGTKHFGNRIVFTDDGHLYLTLAERFLFDPAQDRTNTLGAIVRLARDGSIPEDNPFVGDADAHDAIWSYGHRNIQSAGIHPETGALWVAEMGPMGGDELNKPEAGQNFGWPIVSSGRHYDGRAIADPSTRPEFAQSALIWTPVISPSGMAFYRGDRFPEWQGSALIGGLSGNTVVRLTFDGDTPSEAERIPLSARIRDVAEGPDGAVYVAIDQENGAVWRITPMEPGDETAQD